MANRDKYVDPGDHLWYCKLPANDYFPACQLAGKCEDPTPTRLRRGALGDRLMERRDPRPLRERLAVPHPRVVCAWCNTTLQDGPEPTSHGICAPCARREEQAGRCTSPYRAATVRKATLWGDIIDTHATETELNGFRQTQGRML